MRSGCRACGCARPVMPRSSSCRRSSSLKNSRSGSWMSSVSAPIASATSTSAASRRGPQRQQMFLGGLHPAATTELIFEVHATPRAGKLVVLASCQRVGKQFPGLKACIDHAARDEEHRAHAQRVQNLRCPAIVLVAVVEGDQHRLLGPRLTAGLNLPKLVERKRPPLLLEHGHRRAKLVQRRRAAKHGVVIARTAKHLVVVDDDRIHGRSTSGPRVQPPEAGCSGQPPWQARRESHWRWRRACP